MANHLERLREFQEILAHYRVSEPSKRVLARTRLALLVAPTSTGRNTIIRELLKTSEYHYIISDTTRSPRINDGIAEQNGVEYWFRSEKDLLEDLHAGKFLEAAIIHDQQVSGISIRELEQADNENKIAVTDIEVVGVHNIVAAKPDTYAMFVLPPSFEEWINRLDGRGHMPDDEKRRRLQSAVKEFWAALDNNYYHYVINSTISEAMKQIQSITSGNVDTAFETKGRLLAEELRSTTQAWLESH